MYKVEIVLGVMAVVMVCAYVQRGHIGEKIETNSGDKVCWMVEGETTNRGMILTEETLRMIQMLRESVERELKVMGNGELKEMEFEFKNKIEFAFHFLSNDTSVEVMCLSRI